MGLILEHYNSLNESAKELVEKNILKYFYPQHNAESAILNFDNNCRDREEYEVKIKYDPDRERKLINLVKESDLADWINELVIIFCQLGCNWYYSKWIFHHSKQDLFERNLHDDELRKLKSAFKKFDVSNNQNTQIFQVFLRIGDQEIKLANPLILNIFWAHVNFSALKKYVERTSFRKSLIKEGKRHAYKEFVQVELFGLFNFLKAETLFKEKTNREVYRFIVEFAKLFGVDWKNDILFSSLSTPENYLKDTFKKIKPS
jgi:hypothetical protein